VKGIYRNYGGWWRTSSAPMTARTASATPASES
jgi:hypothetical protein